MIFGLIIIGLLAGAGWKIGTKLGEYQADKDAERQQLFVNPESGDKDEPDTSNDIIPY